MSSQRLGLHDTVHLGHSGATLHVLPAPGPPLAPLPWPHRPLLAPPAPAPGASRSLRRGEARPAPALSWSCLSSAWAARGSTSHPVWVFGCQVLQRLVPHGASKLASGSDSDPVRVAAVPSRASCPSLATARGLLSSPLVADGNAHHQAGSVPAPSLPGGSQRLSLLRPQHQSVPCTSSSPRQAGGQHLSLDRGHGTALSSGQCSAWEARSFQNRPVHPHELPGLLCRRPA